jgi:hypothetical protein
MSEAVLFKGIAFVGAILVGATSFYQLKDDWAARGLDATVTKILLGLLVVGCVAVFLASVGLLGAR